MVKDPSTYMEPQLAGGSKLGGCQPVRQIDAPSSNADWTSGSKAGHDLSAALAQPGTAAIRLGRSAQWPYAESQQWVSLPRLRRRRASTFFRQQAPGKACPSRHGFSALQLSFLRALISRLVLGRSFRAPSARHTSATGFWHWHRWTALGANAPPARKTGPAPGMHALSSVAFKASGSSTTVNFRSAAPPSGSVSVLPGTTSPICKPPRLPPFVEGIHE